MNAIRLANDWLSRWGVLGGAAPIGGVFVYTQRCDVRHGDHMEQALAGKTMTTRKKQYRHKPAPQFTTTEDAKLVRRAIREGWQVPMKNRRRIAEEVFAMIDRDNLEDLRVVRRGLEACETLEAMG